jgi:hypothetical protein
MRNASSKKTALDSQQYQVNLCRFMESLTATFFWKNGIPSVNPKNKEDE